MYLGDMDLRQKVSGLRHFKNDYGKVNFAEFLQTSWLEYKKKEYFYLKHFKVNNEWFNAGADSLEYLSVNGLIQAVNYGVMNKDQQTSGHCTACLTGKYPVELEWWSGQLFFQD